MKWLVGVAAALLSSSALAEDATINAVQLPTFFGAAIGQPVQGLVYRGGLQLNSQTDTFGGLSAIGFVGTEGKLVTVSDRGNFISGQLIYDEANAPLSLSGMKFIVNARFKPDAMVYVNRGTDLLQKGDFRGARVNFEAAIASIPPSGLPIWIAHRFSPTTGNGSWPCKIAMPRCVFAPGFFGLRFCARR